MQQLGAITQLDFTVLFARDLSRLRRFYEKVLRFVVYHETQEQWVEFRVGSTRLALAQRGGTFDDPPAPDPSPTQELAVRVAPGQVDRYADELVRAGVPMAFGSTDECVCHQNLFFRDPDGNVIEIYSE